MWNIIKFNVYGADKRKAIKTGYTLLVGTGEDELQKKEAKRKAIAKAHHLRRCTEKWYWDK